MSLNASYDFRDTAYAAFNKRPRCESFSLACVGIQTLNIHSFYLTQKLSATNFRSKTDELEIVCWPI